MNCPSLLRHAVHHPRRVGYVLLSAVAAHHEVLNVFYLILSHEQSMAELAFYDQPQLDEQHEQHHT